MAQAPSGTPSPIPTFKEGPREECVVAAEEGS